MFIIGGISPKTILLDDRPVRCSSCGLFQAYLKRSDSYLSLFFIPLFRVKKGTPYIFCERCHSVTLPDADPHRPRQETPDVNLCRTCGRTLNPDFRYCPNCGTKR